MPGREIVTKTSAFGLVAASLLLAGVFVLAGPHAQNTALGDYLLGIGLIAMALLTGGLGTLVILGILADERGRRRGAQLHITPRGGAPALPPAWGMGDVGRPGSGVIAVGESTSRGGGTAKAVQFSISNADVPAGIAYLLVWTTVGLIAPVYLWALAAVTVVVGGGVLSVSWLLNRRR